MNLRKTRVGAAVRAANAVILLHEGDVEASTITTWMRLIAPLDRPITVEVCIGGRLLPGVANLWPEDRRCRGGVGEEGGASCDPDLAHPSHPIAWFRHEFIKEQRR